MNLLQRLTSETPKFWVRVQIVCLFCSAAIGWLMGDHIIPATAGYVAAGICGGGAAFAQLAVKDAPIIQEAVNDPSSLIENLPQLMDDMATVKTAITQHIPASFADVTNAIAANAPPPAPQPQPAPAPQPAPVPQPAPAGAPTPQPAGDNAAQAIVDNALGS